MQLGARICFMYAENFLTANSDALFQIVKLKHTGLSIGADSSQIRNIVRKGQFNKCPCYVKIGRKDNLENAITFSQRCPPTAQFKIPICLVSGYFDYKNNELAYSVEVAVEGSSLYDNGEYKEFSQKVWAIVLEIDSIPELNLPRTKKHLEAMKSSDSREDRKKELAGSHKMWLEGGAIRFNTMYRESVSLLEILMDGNLLELGFVHGEFNFHHILFDSMGGIWIIDWERASGAYPRFFDLAEYLARLIVTVYGGIELASSILARLNDMSLEFSRETLLFSIYNRILGTLWEVSQRKQKPFIKINQEVEVVAMLKSYLET